ncbi:bromodomain and PHD finger-containing protein 3-like [Spea bombifrons]|uniref:bromodomain and PHD finger-containing protein 3-like n=1 Tax=Spea bombifrons TaxID=233779 RepID=UPI0023499E01|nr:bromodomain and PHD finger-containing protein 3-like [Spea bombifrons]
MRKLGRQSFNLNNGCQSPFPFRVKCSVTQETMAYTQAPHMVEVEMEGRVHRINIYDKLLIVSENELAAEDIAECNNKENNELAISPSFHMIKCMKQKIFVTPQLCQPRFRVVEPSATPVAKAISVLSDTFYQYIERTAEEMEMDVEYELDEMDMAWLEIVNQKRQNEGLSLLTADTFELLIDKLEKESYMQNQLNGTSMSHNDENACCCICLDDECYNSNVIISCDVCNLAVHQDCYGIPYIPEGQWLCRCCLQSPYMSVSCVLCPNKGGAFKQTSDGRWVHVLCAIWIPEVCFANTVLLEPVEGLNNIPSERWKLMCYLCKQKGHGAAIQCYKINCYTAFHVTCAQQEGLFMKVEPVRETSLNGTTFTVRKIAFCDIHCPKGTVKKKISKCKGRGEESERDEGKKDEGLWKETKGRFSKKKGAGKRKIIENAESASVRTYLPLTVLKIPMCRLHKISNGVHVQRKTEFMQHLHSYWLLKRLSRNGVPLIHRLLSHLKHHEKTAQKVQDKHMSASKEKLNSWKKLRHDLERARTLTELIHKREKLKRQQLKLQQTAMELQLTPFNIFLKSTLDMLEEKDKAKIFTEPVNLKEVPDYMDFVPQPMDFSTMRHKLECHRYYSLHAFEDDFNLMVSNCLHYNSEESVFHQAALQLHQEGSSILSHARHMADSIGYDSHTLLHLADRSHNAEYFRFSWEEVDQLLVLENRNHLSPECQLKELLEKMDFVSSVPSSAARNRRLKLLRKEIHFLRQRLSTQELQKTGITSGIIPHAYSGLRHTFPLDLSGRQAPLGKPNLIPNPTAVNKEYTYQGNLLMSFQGSVELTPLQLVWAKCRGYPSYPALIIDPKMPREGLLHNGVPIPVPPLEVLKLLEMRHIEHGGKPIFLVLFFDNKRTWQWLPSEKLLPLGVDNTVDKLKMLEGRKTSIRKSVQSAYDRAMSHLSNVRSSHPFITPNYL